MQLSQSCDCEPVFMFCEQWYVINITAYFRVGGHARSESLNSWVWLKMF